MDDYFRWTPREDSEKRAIILQQTLMENNARLDIWLQENQPCDDKYFLEESSENLDLFQNEIYDIQHENSSLHTDKYYLTQAINKTDTQLKQMQQDYELCFDDLKRENDVLLTENDDLVKANKKLEKKLYGYNRDLADQLDKNDKLLQHINNEVSKRETTEDLLTEKQKENKNLKREISRLNALDSRYRNRQNQTERVEGLNQALQHAIIDLNLENAGLRKDILTLKRRCDRMSKCRERPDTSVHIHETGGIYSPKSTNKQKSPQPGSFLKKMKEPISEDIDNLNRDDINYLQKECDEWKQKSERFHAKIIMLENQLFSFRRENDTLNDDLNKKVSTGVDLSRHFGKEIQALQNRIKHIEASKLRHNEEDELLSCRLKQQLISCQQEQSLALEKIQEKEDKMTLLQEENEKLVQDTQNLRIHYMEMTMHLKHEKKKWTLEKQDLERVQQAQHLMIKELELRIKQSECTLSAANEELYSVKPRNAKQERTQYANTNLKYEIKSEKNRNTEKIKSEENAEKLIVMNKELERERSRSTILSKEINQYKEQVEQLKKAQVDLSHYHALLRQDYSQSKGLIIAAENNQQLERNLSDPYRSKEDMIGEIVSLNDKATKFSDAIEKKDRNISNLQNELERKNQEIEDIKGELALIKEKNVENERLISDLHIKMSDYKSKLNETSPNSGKLTNTISHLEREVEGYKNELKMAREEIEHATEKIQQAERNVSDLKISEHAWNEKVDSQNDQIKQLAEKKDNDISRLENKLQRKCQKIEKTMTEVALIKGQNESNEQLITRLQIELDQNKANLKDENSNSAEMNNIITTLRGKVETYESELKQAREEIRNATEKSQQMNQKISAIKISEQSLVDERDSLKDKVKELTTVLRRRESEIRDMETKMAEFSSIKEKNIKFENDKGCHSAEMSRTISHLKREVEKNQSELKQAIEGKQRCDLQLKSVNDEHGYCQNRIASLHKENEKLRSIATYKGDQTKRSESVLSQREQELSIALEKAKRELREVQHDLEDTKTRLSKVMGQKLTDNNPNIADLSDKNRPTKLAERYSELYDNQWTDAFEIVYKQLHDEKSTIDSLIDILMTAAKFCRGEAMKQLEEIQGILLPKKVGTALPLLVHKNLKDCRKALGDLTGTAIYEKYIEENARRNPRSPHNDVKPFVKECIELCWLMSIQDPPVIIEPVVRRGSKFDTDFYKAYTSSGPLVDYVVWPALCLHEKGPLLCKGIAQGYGGKKTTY